MLQGGLGWQEHTGSCGVQLSPTSAERYLHIRAKAARMELICLLSLDVLCTAWKQPL